MNKNKLSAVAQTVLAETLLAYADCRDPIEQGMAVRRLQFHAAHPVSRDEARIILREAIPHGYNEFTHRLLAKFPANARVLIAREFSVGLYVWGSDLPERDVVKADTMDVRPDGSIHYWWD